MKTATIKIEGMSCQHCVKAVGKELAKLKNVIVNDVTVGTATISYDGSAETAKSIAEAIALAGFRVTNFS
jgi:copper chaperone